MEYCSAYLICVASPSQYKITQNFHFWTYRKIIALSLLRSGCVYDFKTVSHFFLIIFAEKFDVIFWNHFFCLQVFNQTWS